jgi:acyl-CoA synthetase (NDP forming)
MTRDRSTVDWQRRRALEVLFEPASVAIIGASARPGTWGHTLATGALAGRADRPVHLVNPRGGILDGTPFASALTEHADLVVIATPPEHFESAVDAALDAGAQAIVGVTAGVSPAVQQAVTARVKEHGAVLLGPNCMGVADPGTRLSLLWGDLPAGDIALLSQSGNLAIELGAIARRAGLGFARFASLGNAADVTAVDLIPLLAGHERTRAIALYLEDVGDGRALLAAAEAAQKPVVLLAAGRSAAGAAAARSHTGALATNSAVLAAACREAGIRLVRTPTELIEATRAGRPATEIRTVGIVADGGGHGVIAADLASAAGVEVPRFGDALRERLAALLPPTSATGNPVDLAGGGERDITSYASVVRAVLASGEVDAALLTGYFGGYGTAAESAVAAELAAVRESTGRPLFVHSVAPESAAAGMLTAAGVPVWGAIEYAVGALGQRRMPRSTGPALPTQDLTGEPGYFGARAALTAAGVSFAEARPAGTLDEILDAAGRIGYPVALKATGHAHKTEAGGVALGLAGPAELAAAYRRMNVSSPFSVEAMVDTNDGVELIVGGRRDPHFGPVVLVGAGGVLTELVADTAVRLAPIGTDTAYEMVAELRVAALLAGFRGRAPVAVGALAELIATVSRLIAAYPRIRELDLNPVLVTSTGTVALDAHWELT